MAKDYAKSFYQSTKWKKCRSSFLASKNYICERCNGVALVVHHKEYITPGNIDDYNITLSWDNLEALCQDCHQKEHHSKSVCIEGLSFNSNGELIQTPINKGK